MYFLNQLCFLTNIISEHILNYTTPFLNFFYVFLGVLTEAFFMCPREGFLFELMTGISLLYGDSGRLIQKVHFLRHEKSRRIRNAEAYIETR